jgi:hypothetical protein
MTTISLVVAMIPAALARGSGSEATRSIAIVVIGGQTLCLLITLLITPVAYSLFEDLGACLARAVASARMPRLSRAVNVSKSEARGRPASR